MEAVRKLTENCIHCGCCTSVCGFLKEYKMDLQEFSEHPELAYCCNLCRACYHVCPRDIDGREVALLLHREQVAE